MKKIVLTGALKAGYGEAILRKLIENNYFVYGTFEKELSNKSLDILNELNNIELFEVDHSDRVSVQNFVNQIKGNKIDGLINAQMFFEIENIENFDYNLWDKSLAVNLTTPNFLFHELKTSMNKGSSVIIVTSTEAFTGSFGGGTYACTKAAIHNLVKTHANISGENDIRVNAVAAGWVGGVMDTDEVFNLSRNITPLKRLCEPKEIADVVYFLVSPNSSFVNGSVITVDGGYTGVDTIAKFEFESAQ